MFIPPIAYFFLILVFIFSCAVTLVLYYYKRRYELQTSKMIQLYLNSKFVSRMLILASEHGRTYQSKILSVISDIKEYFQLEEIVLYCHQEKKSPISQHTTSKQDLVTKYIDKNIEGVSVILKNQGIYVERIDSVDLKSMIYIFEADGAKNIDYIVFVHDPDDKLSTFDIETLRYPVRIILSDMLSKIRIPIKY